MADQNTGAVARETHYRVLHRDRPAPFSQLFQWKEELASFFNSEGVVEQELWRDRIGQRWDAARPNWRLTPPSMVLGFPGPCSYLKGLFWRLVIIEHTELDLLLELGGQRFGTTFCVPACHGCSACSAARIPVERFEMRRSQRRTWRRNQDLEVEIGPVVYTPEKFELMKTFLHRRFGNHLAHLLEDSKREAFYRNWMLYRYGGTLEFRYRLNGRLVAVGSLDHSARNAYSHYFFYDPDEQRRRLGIYSFLFELDWCRRQGLEHLYIGFYNERSPSMRYKNELQPLQLLHPQRGWEG